MIRLSFLLAALTLAACSGPETETWHGYAEGDFVAIAPDAPGRLVAVEVREGEQVEAGQILFRLEDTAERAALAAAEAQLEAAMARFDDAAAGARDPEVGAAREQLRQAAAQLAEAESAWRRARDLFEAGHVSQARLDDAQAGVETARARVDELRQRLALVQLPAREHALRALQAQIGGAQAEIERARFALDRRRTDALATARVYRQIRYAGEQAGPGLPVLSLLPDDAVHAVLFIPAPKLAAVQPGTRLAVGCDSCPAGLTATIAFIDDRAEFTPPIIYSDAERARLVYRAEARFERDAPPPGTPLRIRIAP